MRIEQVKDYAEMSHLGARNIYNAIAAKVSAGQPCNLGLATGNTMIKLYELLAEHLNTGKLDLSNLQTWNLDAYAIDDQTAIPHDHPLSYWRYMQENFFCRLAAERHFKAAQMHFPDPADPAKFDRELASAGGLDLQLLGIGFNGHIAFNEPQQDSVISVAAFAELPTRVLPLTEETIQQNTALTANGDREIVPRFAATAGMKSILAARQELLLACFAKQEAPLRRMLSIGQPTPELPASYLLTHPDAMLIYTADSINLDGY